MKNTLPLILLTLLCACGQNTHPTKNTAVIDTTVKPSVAGGAELSKDPEQVVYEVHAAQLVQYRDFINGLSGNNMNNVRVAVSKYKEMFKPQGSAVNDSALALFRHFYLVMNDSANNLFMQVFRDFADTASPEQTAEQPSERQFVNDVKADGYNFKQSEGQWYLGLEWDSVAAWLAPYLSVPMQQYLAQTDSENSRGFMEDGYIVIEAKEVAGRAIWWEQFVAANPAFALRHLAVYQQQLYLAALLNGCNDDRDNAKGMAKLGEGFKEAYEVVFAQYPSSQVAKTIRPYYNAMTHQRYAAADSLLDAYRKQGLTMW